MTASSLEIKNEPLVRLNFLHNLNDFRCRKICKLQISFSLFNYLINNMQKLLVNYANGPAVPAHEPVWIALTVGLTLSFIWMVQYDAIGYRAQIVVCAQIAGSFKSDQRCYTSVVCTINMLSHAIAMQLIGQSIDYKKKKIAEKRLWSHHQRVIV